MPLNFAPPQGQPVGGTPWIFIPTTPPFNFRAIDSN